MKVLIITPPWIGGLFDFMAKSFRESGNEVVKLTYSREFSMIRKFKLHNIVQINNYLEKQSIRTFNDSIVKRFKEFKPDLFISMNEAYLLPSTVMNIQSTGCTTVNFVSDNPFDPLRFSFFPMTLKYYEIIFVFDRIWIPGISNVAAKSKIHKLISGGAYNQNLFYPLNNSSFAEDDLRRFSCDVSFTGESYGMRGEAGYRSEILDQLGSYNVKIWGDSDWNVRFPYYTNLARFYQGERLNYEELRKLYCTSTINLNMPSPQVLTGFQARTFEIAACKGFQIADWREELDEWFTENELVTFKNIPDLLEKIDFFIKNPEKRLPFIGNMYKKVSENHTWDVRVKEILPMLT